MPLPPHDLQVRAGRAGQFERLLQSNWPACRRAVAVPELSSSSRPIPAILWRIFIPQRELDDSLFLSAGMQLPILRQVPCFLFPVNVSPRPPVTGMLTEAQKPDEILQNGSDSAGAGPDVKIPVVLLAA